MQKQLENLTTSDDRIAVAGLDDISEPQNREEIAALANEFWQRWNTRRGLVPRKKQRVPTSREWRKQLHSGLARE